MFSRDVLNSIYFQTVIFIRCVQSGDHNGYDCGNAIFKFKKLEK